MIDHQRLTRPAEVDTINHEKHKLVGSFNLVLRNRLLAQIIDCIGELVEYWYKGTLILYPCAGPCAEESDVRVISPWLGHPVQVGTNLGAFQTAETDGCSRKPDCMLSLALASHPP